MSIDLEAIPDEAIRAAEVRIEEHLDEFASDLGASVADSDSGDAFMARTTKAIAVDALTTAAPLLRAPLVAEVERLRAIVEAVEKLVDDSERMQWMVLPTADTTTFQAPREVPPVVPAAALRAALSPSTPLVEPSGVGE